MHNYTHHIAGRWRTRYPQIKNQPGRARAVETALRRIKGVTLVEASPLTGSLLICYDAHGADRVALMEALHAAKRELGLAAAPSRVEPMANEMKSDTLGDKLLGMLVEKCVERSALALIAALI
jgi:hypothetical protein